MPLPAWCHTHPEHLRKLRWAIALYISIGYLLLPYLPDVVIFLRHILPYAIFSAVINIAFFMAAGIFLLAIFTKYHNWQNFPLAFAPFPPALWCVFHYVSEPPEQIHFIQYTLLALLIFQTMQPSFNSWLWTCVATFAAGMVDEGIQGLLPSRAADFHDLFLNGFSGILGGWLAWRLSLPPLPAGDSHNKD